MPLKNIHFLGYTCKLFAYNLNYSYRDHINVCTSLFDLEKENWALTLKPERQHIEHTHPRAILEQTEAPLATYKM